MVFGKKNNYQGMVNHILSDLCNLEKSLYQQSVEPLTTLTDFFSNRRSLNDAENSIPKIIELINKLSDEKMKAENLKLVKSMNNAIKKIKKIKNS